MRTDRHTTQTQTHTHTHSLTTQTHTHTHSQRRSRCATKETENPTGTLTDIKTDTKDGFGSINENYTGEDIIKHACSTSFTQSTHTRVHDLCSMLGCSSPTNTYTRKLRVAHSEQIIQSICTNICIDLMQYLRMRVPISRGAWVEL